jgi:hypothetical protein
MRTLLWLCVALLAIGACAEDADPLRTAIMSKSREQLEEICVKASIPWTPGGDLDELRALVYEFAQREKPGTPTPWKAGATATKKTPEQKQSELMFQAMDSDKNGVRTHTHSGMTHSAHARSESLIALSAGDCSFCHAGKLTLAELKAMVDKVNAAAMKAGEATVDPNEFFSAMDANKDNVVDRTEANELAAYMTSKTAASGKQQAKPKAAKGAAATGGAATGETPDYAAAMFTALDSNKDGQLTREEMQSLLDQAQQHNKAQVSPGPSPRRSLQSLRASPY